VGMVTNLWVPQSAGHFFIKSIVSSFSEGCFLELVKIFLHLAFKLSATQRSLEWRFCCSCTIQHSKPRCLQFKCLVYQHKGGWLLYQCWLAVTFTALNRPVLFSHFAQLTWSSKLSDCQARIRMRVVHNVGRVSTTHDFLLL